MVKNTVRTKPQPCPSCGRILDAVSAAEGEMIMPKPGDVSVCIYCAEVLEVTRDYRLTVSDYRDGEIDMIVAAAKELIARKMDAVNTAIAATLKPKGRP